MDKIMNFLFSRKVMGPFLVVVVGYIIYKIAETFVDKVFNHGINTYEQKKRTTIIELVMNIFKFFIIVIMIVFILNLYGVDTRSIVASLGIAGAFLGLALQETAQDFISGIAIITDNYYVIGDMVTINGFTGEVIELSLKSTKIRRFNGEVMVLPNHSVTSVINISQERAGVKIDIPTRYEESVERVETVIKKILDQIKKIPNVYADTKYLGIDAFEGSSITYSILIYCKQSEQWDIKRRALRIIKKTYDEENLSIPYSQIEVHYGANEEI